MGTADQSGEHDHEGKALTKRGCGDRESGLDGRRDPFEKCGDCRVWLRSDWKIQYH